MIKKLLIPLLLLISVISFAQKDTLYSNNICVYENTQHVQDISTITRIVINDTVTTFFYDNTSFSIIRHKLRYFEKFEDGEQALSFNATLKEKPVIYIILFDRDKNIKALSFFLEIKGLVFSIVSKYKNL